ncbi:MAG: glycosyltransferase family 2 protein [Alphaproteobacteria bacterium]|uniref:Glycosyltransferase family 2 protein n=1 Tax=Candidatus Nitrobium versatile TaxID=2884831 RepID=A0A953M3X7_9BACT|nr:glycosyltransferase family 2 protein [Candidatus Nitrobium versatile]
MPKVSIIIVNFNGERVIRECLTSLAGQSFRDFEVVLVDNGSADRSVTAVEDFLKESGSALRVKLITLPENRGFTGGNIEGLRHCSGEYIALLNNDTEVEERWLEELVAAMESHPGAGICASKMIAHDTGRIDSAGDIFSTALKGFKRGEGEPGERYCEEEYVFGACAGAALYRRSMLEEIGFLDEDFFLIHEDTDLNLRAQLTGWRTVYVPSAVVFHKVRASIGAMSDTAVYYSLRNSDFVRIKNIPAGVFLRCLPALVAGVIAEFVYFSLKHRRPGLYVKAKRDALLLLPRMLRKRSEIMKKRKVTGGSLYSLMTPAWQNDFLKARLDKLLHG